MIVTGDAAKKFDAIRLDSFEPVNKGELLEANEETGMVRWNGHGGGQNSVTLGPKSIKIMAKSSYGR